MTPFRASLGCPRSCLSEASCSCTTVKFPNLLLGRVHGRFQDISRDDSDISKLLAAREYELFLLAEAEEPSALGSLDSSSVSATEKGEDLAGILVELTGRE
jgi:hypothetical protein